MHLLSNKLSIINVCFNINSQKKSILFCNLKPAAMFAILTKHSLLMVLALLLLVTNTSSLHLIAANSSHVEGKGFSVTLSFLPNQLSQIYAPKLYETKPHIFNVSTVSQSLTINPDLNSDKILFKNYHEGRYFLSFYDIDKASNLKSIFYYLQLTNNNEREEYLMAGLSHEIGLINLQRLYKCGSVMVSIRNEQNNALIIVLSNSWKWNLALKNVDDGFRHYDHDVYYGSFIDVDHRTEEGVMIEIGEEEYCEIREDSPVNHVKVDGTKTINFDHILKSMTNPLNIRNKIKETQGQAEDNYQL